MRLAICALVAFFSCACVGTTGGEPVDFQAAASGPTDAVAGQPLVFDASHGWHVTLDSARLHIGALYLADSAPVSGAQAISCQLPGSYVAQVRDGLDVDLLSGAPQPFPSGGQGVTVEALAGQVWLTGGDVNVVDDPKQPAVILDLAGTAALGAEQRPFTAALTIAGNRVTVTDGAASGVTICQQRIVSRNVALEVQDHGVLRLRIDPRRLFTNVDFGALEASGNTYVFRDDSSDQPSANLYNNLTGAGLYAFTWEPKLQ